MHNSQFIIDTSETQNIASLLVGFDLPLSKSVRARELVLDALNGCAVEIEDDNDDIFVLSRALKQCTIFAISENNQACLDCRAEQKSRQKEVMHNAQLSDQSDQSDNSQLSTLNFQLSTFNSQLSTFNSQLFIARDSKTFGSTFNFHLSNFNLNVCLN